MTFQEKLDRILQRVEYVKGERQTFSVVDNAREMGFKLDGYRLTDPLVNRILEEGLELTEEREKEMRIVINEIVGNSVRHGCDEREDLNVMYQVCLGNKGVVIRVRDDGEGFDTKKLWPDL